MFPQYNGLLLVHPEWFAYPGIEDPQNIDRVYANMRNAQTLCSQLKIPFIVTLSCDKDQREWSPIDKLGLSSSNYHEIDSENSVFEIENVIQMSADQISLLFGGFMYEHCVKNWVDQLCININRTEKDIGIREDWSRDSQFWKSSKKFASGRIVHELTDYIIN